MTADFAPTQLGRAPYLLSGLLAVDAAIASGICLLRPDLIHSPAVIVGNLQGTAVTIAALGVPALVASMIAARKGHALGLAGWIGALLYLGYQGGLLLFGTPFNGLFPLFVALASLALWSGIVLAVRLPSSVIEPVPASRQDRLVALWLTLQAVAFYALWFKAVGPALTASDAPAFLAGTGMTTGPIQVMDLVFFLPLTLVAAYRSRRGLRFGRLLAGAVTVQLVIEAFSIGLDQWMGAAADPASPVASAALTPVFFLAAATSLGCLWLHARPARRASRALSATPA
ncbi:MAG: hypothetical protein U0838_11540 [Chloroflexota bacterium]